MMNELDFILVFIILVGAGVGLRRGLVRVFISIIGIHFTVLMAGYAYEPIGETVHRAANRIGIGLGLTAAQNLTYIVVVIAATVAVEVVSRSTFEETRLRPLRDLDNLLGGIAGVLYGALWAALFLVPSQYGIAQGSRAWSTAVNGSKLVPTLNNVFKVVVLNLVSILFIDGIPKLYLNRVTQKTSYLLFQLASLRYLFL
jgi:uncharacterized membrane protein required for colicin V production